MKPIIQKLVTLTAMLLSMLTASAYDFEYNGMYFNITSTANLTCAITYRDKNYNTYAGNVTIPSEVEYKGRTLTVTEIGVDAFLNCSNLTSVNIPNSVRAICGFKNCTSLTTINIPNSVIWIYGGSFYGCTSLTSVNIPNSVKYIGQSAFTKCSSLTSVNIPNSVTEIGKSAFSYCSSLTSVNIPNSVTEIYQTAFEGCSSLTSVNIPNSIAHIQWGVFSYCSSLISVTIPNSVTNIDTFAFCGCSSLTAVEIPNSVTKIGESAFEGCRNLTSVAISNSVTEIKDGTFSDCNSLISIKIPAGVERIGTDAFNGCSNLKQMIFEKGEKELNLSYNKNQGMFSEEKSLTDIVIGRSILYYKESAVWEKFRDGLDLKYLTDLTFLDDVDIKDFFSYYYNNYNRRGYNDYSGTLVNLTIGKNVANYPYSLEQYSNLQTITLKDPVPQRCPKFVTKQYTDMIIYVPKGSLSAYQNASGWRNFWDIREGEYSGIEDTAVTPEKTEVGRYDLQGGRGLSRHGDSPLLGWLCKEDNSAVKYRGFL